MMADVRPAGHQVVLLLKVLHDGLHVPVFASLYWELRHLQRDRSTLMRSRDTEKKKERPREGLFCAKINITREDILFAVAMIAR